MTALTLHRARARLTRELASWQLGAIGLLILATLGNMALTARICTLETARAEDAARYQTQLQQAEHIRDMAVQQLGALVLEKEADAAARKAQEGAYAAVENYRYVGECTVTYYCPCEACCGRWADGLTATGIPAVPGIVAVDPDVIALGSTVIIDGQKYLAADTGVTGNHVDLCVLDHQEAKAFGVRTADVWVVTG